MSPKGVISLVLLSAFICIIFSIYQLLNSGDAERLDGEEILNEDFREIQRVIAHANEVAKITVGIPAIQPEYIDSEEDGLVCKDVSSTQQCSQWSDAGECEKNYYGMIHYCPATCGHCDGLDRPDGRKLHYRPSASLGYAVSPVLAPVVLSWKPRAFLYPYFLSNMECERLIQLGIPRLQRSQTVTETLAKAKGEATPESKVRTSSGSDFSGMAKNEPVVIAIEERIARTVMVPVENGEPMQILKYEPGQYYQPHPDHFSADALKSFHPESGNRAITILMYLSDVEEGGETWFPDGTPADPDSPLNEKACATREIKSGFSLKPRKGWALVFYSETLMGEADKFAVHGSCEVIKGEKYSATKWIRKSTFPVTP